MYTIGTFKGVSREAVICRASTGSDYVGLVLESIEGPTTGERIAASLWWTENTKERTKAALVAMGWAGEVTTGTDGVVNLVGLTKPVAFGTIEEEYKGKKSIKVDWVHDPAFGNAINAKDKQRMSAQVASMIAEMGGKAPAMANGGRRAAPPPWDGQGSDPADDFPR